MITIIISIIIINININIVIIIIIIIIISGLQGPVGGSQGAHDAGERGQARGLALFMSKYIVSWLLV